MKKRYYGIKVTDASNQKVGYLSMFTKAGRIEMQKMLSIDFAKLNETTLKPADLKEDNPAHKQFFNNRGLLTFTSEGAGMIDVNKFNTLYPKYKAILVTL